MPLDRSRLVLGSVLVMASPALADVIISNLPGNDGTSTFMNAPPGGANGGGVHDSKAAGFTMPAGGAYRLDAVRLRLNFFNTASIPVVQIYSNVSNNPGTLIETLNNPPFTVGMAEYDFTSSSAATLSPGETYWVVVWNNATVANSFQWMASSPGQAPTGLATNAGYRFMNGPPPPTTNSTTINSYAVAATAAGGCYPNCDQSTQPPVLNVQDFTCFLQRYASGESYANCDQSTQAPVLNVQDFTCFLQRYAAGCP